MSADLVPIGETAKFVNGMAFRASDWTTTGSPIIRIQNLTNPSRSFNRTHRPVPPQLHVNPGDILVSWSATLGVFEWPGPEIGVLNQHIFRVMPDPARVHNRYLAHVLRFALQEMQRHLHGATMQHVNRGEFLATPVFLPSLGEQRRIADVLDRVASLLVKRHAAIAQLNSLTQSMFLDMFGPKARHRSECKVIPLGLLCSVIRDGVHQTPEYMQTGVPFVTVRNIVSGTLDLQDTKSISEADHLAFTRRVKPEVGDVLVSKDGTIGVPCPITIDKEFSIFVSVALLKPKRDLVDQTFLVAQFRTDQVQDQIKRNSKGIAIRHLHLEDFRRLDFLVPPLSLQREFSYHVHAIEHVGTQFRSSSRELDNLFASLQHRAFRGEL